MEERVARTGKTSNAGYVIRKTKKKRKENSVDFSPQANYTD
jgi:hypothetical protein